MGGVADEPPEWAREDRLGPYGTRTVTLVPVPTAGPDCCEGTASSAPAAALRSDASGCFGMRFAMTSSGDGKDLGPLIIIWTGGIVKHLGSTIIERVEAFVRHPVFAGSDKALDLALNDLRSPHYANS
jgi:hypothetical protein